MVESLLLNSTAVDDVRSFYTTHAYEGLLYPKDPRWMEDHLGADFFLVGIKISGELAAVAWIARLEDFVYFAIENERLVAKNDGPYVYSGGWCVRPEARGRGLLRLLAAAVNLFWFTKINPGEAAPVWGRMVGTKDVDGNPLFWNQVGEDVTGLSYHQLLELPFGTIDKTIFTHWPKNPMPLKEIPNGVLEQTLGKTWKPLVVPLEQFVKWGLVEVVQRYVPTSLNYFHRTTKDSIPNPQEFFQQALSRTSTSAQT